MPPKTKVTKEMILSAVLEITKKKRLSLCQCTKHCSRDSMLNTSYFHLLCKYGTA